MQTHNEHKETLRQLTEDVLGRMKQTFTGKEEIIDLLGICLVGGENLFMLGPPGTAKSALVQHLGRLIDGNTFDYLLTRFTEPNELFGPFDIRRLREGELLTNTEGMLPEANLIFLDELLNANSAILNSLLMVLNERVFRRGKETRPLPALMVVGASNHLPEDDALRALFDRFLLRVHCDNVPSAQLHEVLVSGWNLESTRQSLQPTVTTAAIQQLQGVLPGIDLSELRPQYLDLVQRLRNAGIAISDRRAVKLQRVIAASALICDRNYAKLSDLWVLRYIWATEEQQEVIAAIVTEYITKDDANDQDHPRARQEDIPDAESLAKSLEDIQVRLQSVDTAAEDLSFLKDRLTHLSGRSQWLKNPTEREHLQSQLQKLWQTLEDS